MISKCMFRPCLTRVVPPRHWRLCLVCRVGRSFQLTQVTCPFTCLAHVVEAIVMLLGRHACFGAWEPHTALYVLSHVLILGVTVFVLPPIYTYCTKVKVT